LRISLRFWNVCRIFTLSTNNKYYKQQNTTIMKALTLNEILNIKFETVLTKEGCEVTGYMDAKTIEFGNWIIAREGKCNKEGVYIHWAGDWSIIKDGKIYTTKKTLKEAKRYILIWLQYNPSDY